jgi:hypothetical protein
MGCESNKPGERGGYVGTILNLNQIFSTQSSDGKSHCNPVVSKAIDPPTPYGATGDQKAIGSFLNLDSNRF